MKKIISLGAILSLSGEASQDAGGIRDGIELAVKELKKMERMSLFIMLMTILTL